MAPIAKPEARIVRPTSLPVHVPPTTTANNTSEAARVRRIQEAVGGPTALSTLADPSAVRAAVILALAHEQTAPEEYARIARGDLTQSERRIVRTVTNRGAAVRSRLRQRRELHRLRAELRAKDERVRALESALRDAMAAGLVLPGHLSLYPDTTNNNVTSNRVGAETTSVGSPLSMSPSLHNQGYPMNVLPPPPLSQHHHEDHSSQLQQHHQQPQLQHQHLPPPVAAVTATTTGTTSTSDSLLLDNLISSFS